MVRKSKVKEIMYQKAWRKKNVDHLRKYRKAWRLKNLESVKARQNKWARDKRRQK